jgi:Zn-dependent protease
MTAGLKSGDEMETTGAAPKTFARRGKTCYRLATMPTRQGSFHLFKLFGINVYLHWSWFLVLLYEIQVRKGLYSSITWNVLECVTLFAIVLMHEFGHALACRSVGGQANQIVLWPFGGVAYIAPPQRAGAQLWSIAAGPLVNVILFPILSLTWWLAYSQGMDQSSNLYTYVFAMWVINLSLLIFNMLPIYPLDGGQILRSLLWFVMGLGRSLMTATIIGFVGATGLILFAIWAQSVWLGAICLLILFNCFQGFQRAREMMRLANAQRYLNYVCPACKAPAPVGDFWMCAKCRKKFDAIATQLTCPHCNTHYERVACFQCGAVNPLPAWAGQTAPTEPIGPP